jgi:heat-inducible transcriptional repressor
MVVADTSSILKGVDDEAELAHYMDGLRLLLGQPELAHSRLARDLVEVLEEKVALRELLSGAPEKGMVRVFIGEENPEGALKSFSVILSQYGIPNEAAGTVCVIGPTRMEYASVIAGVRFLSDVMSDLVFEVQGKSW